jgi:hypothetical protein
MTEWSTENQVRRPNKLISQELLHRLHRRRNDIGLIFFSGHLVALLTSGSFGLSDARFRLVVHSPFPSRCGDCAFVCALP